MFNAHNQFEQIYFSTFKEHYTTGDGAERDSDGYYWITGRVDDVLNVSGHRLGTNELESALSKHDKVAEAAVVGYPHLIKGQGIYAYVVLYEHDESSDSLKTELIAHVRKIIGPIATLDRIQWTDGLPKTRSGKVMRRILRKIAEGELENLGDISTLADESIVKRLIDGFQKV
jgi:acetyl-CoA synthetase